MGWACPGHKVIGPPYRKAGKAGLLRKRTASIAREIRRAIRRGHPSGALEMINNQSNLRYLTATEEAHLRGEIAHAYFIFGVDDKAVRTARQAIAKDTEEAFMGYWAGAWAAGVLSDMNWQAAFSGLLLILQMRLMCCVQEPAFGPIAHLCRLVRQPEATRYLSIAAQYPETFYGVMAIKASGQRYEIDFTLPGNQPRFYELACCAKRVASGPW